MDASSLANPLALVSRDPLVHELITYLSAGKARLADSGSLDLVFSRSQLVPTRQAFSESIRRGEEKLHLLCGLIATAFFQDHYHLQSVIIGETGPNQRFTLRQTVRADEVLAQTDLDLGNRLLGKVQMRQGGTWRQPRLVANFVEYQPEFLDDYAIHKMISRIKAEEEIWNKVVDEIFDLDALVKRDKQLAKLSRYVKDVFGIKIVVAMGTHVRPLHFSLENLAFSESALTRCDVPIQRNTLRPRLLEVKDYLGHEKKSGWQAMKSVLQWWDMTFEVQVQPLMNYFREREYLTRESHAAFKERRERIRETIASEHPLFRFYRDLLRWLFEDQSEPLPTHPGVTVTLRD